MPSLGGNHVAFDLKKPVVPSHSLEFDYTNWMRRKHFEFQYVM